MIAEFERMARDLEDQINIEQERSGIRDTGHFAYPTFAKAAMQRRDNLRASAAGAARPARTRPRTNCIAALDELQKHELMAERDQARSWRRPISCDEPPLAGPPPRPQRSSPASAALVAVGLSHGRIDQRDMRAGRARQEAVEPRIARDLDREFERLEAHALVEAHRGRMVEACRCAARPAPYRRHQAAVERRDSSACCAAPVPRRLGDDAEHGDFDIVRIRLRPAQLGEADRHAVPLQEMNLGDSDRRARRATSSSGMTSAREP